MYYFFRVQILDKTNHISIASNLTETSHNLIMKFISIYTCSTKLTDNNGGDYLVYSRALFITTSLGWRHQALQYLSVHSC